MDNPSYPRRSSSQPTPQVRSTPAIVKPQSRMQRSNSMGDHHSNQPTFSPPPPPEKLTLPLFVARFHGCLPLCVRVCRGFCGPSEEMSISEGDHFSIHFVKHTTVVVLESPSKNRFNVPLNSAVLFGLLYNPNNNHSEALKGYKFDKVSDMLQRSTLPLVVRARKGHQDSNPGSSLAANELLVLKKVCTKLLGKKVLKVYSVTTGREKTLNENCIGHFSTKPRDVSMYLPEIVKHLPDAFPCKAVLFNTAESANVVPSKLSLSVVTLLHSSINTSLVATSVLERDLENARLLDIPIDLDIQVRVVGTDEMEAWRLRKDTSYLFDNFNPARLCPYVSNPTSRSVHEMQSELYMNVRTNQEDRYRGIEVAKPQTFQVPSHYQCPRPVRDCNPQSTEIAPHSPDEKDALHSFPKFTISKASAGVTSNGQGSHSRRSPGYDYVETNPTISARPIKPNGGGASSSRLPVATDPIRDAQKASITSDTAHNDCSFGSAGSGGAIVERTRAESLSDVRRPESVFLDTVITEFEQITQELDSALVMDSDEVQEINSKDSLHLAKEDNLEAGVQSRAQPRFQFSPSPVVTEKCEASPDMMTKNRRLLSQMNTTLVSKTLF